MTAAPAPPQLRPHALWRTRHCSFRPRRAVQQQPPRQGFCVHPAEPRPTIRAFASLLPPPPPPLQLTYPTVKYAPCNDATEHTCSGTDGSGSAAICCNKMNFACGVRLDTGGPRCAMCPQVCIMDCMPGYKCGRDANGCFNCLPDPSGGGGGFIRGPPPPSPPPPSPRPPPPAENRLGDTCSAAQPCPARQICAAGYCRANPCIRFTCTADKPRCTVDRVSFRAQCVAGDCPSLLLPGPPACSSGLSLPPEPAMPAVSCCTALRCPATAGRPEG